jgi:ferric-dicitrate binding protein FerR (iron transport regulator)
MARDIDDVFANYLCGEPLDDEGRAIIDEWTALSEENGAFEAGIHRLQAQRLGLKGRAGEEAAFQTVEERVRRRRQRRRWLRAGSLAAGILLLVGWALLFGPRRGEEAAGLLATATVTIQPGRPAAELVFPDGRARWLTPETVILSDSLHEIKTIEHTLVYVVAGEAREQEMHLLNIPAGGEYDLLLADGTRVYLNAGSTLRYPNFFTGDREVVLTGEGYFEVARDADHPFIVRSGDLSVRVLGTSFNINAYPDRSVLVTTLVEGRVRAGCGDRSFDMSPGTQVRYNRETGESVMHPVDVEMYTSWKDGYYIFENMPLEELMTNFALWYDLRVAYRDEGVKGIKFSGSLKRYDDIVPLLKKLEYTRDVEFIIENNLITIKRK